MKNSEKYRTADERENAFVRFCNGEKPCDKCQLNNIVPKRLGCAYAWLDLEVEEEKPMPCPYCGNECKIMFTVPAYDYYFVKCGDNKCSYNSRIMLGRDKAIAAHNRICRAVKAANKESEVKE